MYSEGHKYYVTDVKLDLTVMLLDRILLLQGLFIDNSLIVTHDQTCAWTICGTN